VPLLRVHDAWLLVARGGSCCGSRRVILSHVHGVGILLGGRVMARSCSISILHRLQA
jgi:hypothetical protein